MVNGPPTPPATSPTELQDEARGNSSTTAEVPPSQNTPPTNKGEYQIFLSTLGDAIARRDYQRLVHTAEETDFNRIYDRQQTQLIIISPLVLGYLVLDDLPPARYALLRLPEHLSSLPLSRALMALVTATMNREHANVYHQTAALLALVSKPDFLDNDLSTILTVLLEQFRESFLERTFELISKAYTSLPLALATTYLGRAPEQILEAVEKTTWTYDANTQILHPKPRARVSSQASSNTSSLSSLATFHFVSESVAMLEL